MLIDENGIQFPTDVYEGTIIKFVNANNPEQTATAEVKKVERGRDGVDLVLTMVHRQEQK